MPFLDADNNSLKNNSIPEPSRKLTYTNGFYVDCAALFVDIRESSTMTDEHKRPVLAKVYRSFISEIVALFNENNITKESKYSWGLCLVYVTHHISLILMNYSL